MPALRILRLLQFEGACKILSKCLTVLVILINSNIFTSILQDSMKKFRDETQKLEQAEALKKAREKFVSFAISSYTWLFSHADYIVIFIILCRK